MLRTRAFVTGVVATAVLAGCSVTDTPERVPDYLTPSSVKDLLDGCLNIQDGYPGAAEYTGDGPHTVAIFAKSLVSDASLNGTGGRPYPGRTKLNVCAYESVISMGRYPTEVPLYSQLYTFKVYELRTGRLVDTLQLETATTLPVAGGPGLFEGGTKVFAKAQPAELDDLFTPIATGSARRPG